MNFWETRWHEGRIGFHLKEINSYLIRFCNQLLKNKTESVFVPFCGKTLDLCWLAERTNKVVGVELVEKAVEDFFEENKIKYITRKIDKFKIFQNLSIDIFHGDFFELSNKNTGQFEAIYDRASIVSIETYLRKKYVSHLMSFLAKRGRILLITLEYDQSQMSGPPFSVPVIEIKNLFSEFGSVELLETSNIIDDRLRDKGLEGILERVFKITKC